MNTNNILKIVQENNLGVDLIKGNFGLEKENLRVDEKGNLAATKHPKVFGDKLKNPFITVDFAESQIEMITPALPSITDMYNFLENLHDIVSIEVGDEYLWPQSTPANLPCENIISAADFNDSEAGVEARKYREVLTGKYGKRKQLLSGIHYNFSFENNFLEKLYKASDGKEGFNSFKNNIYLKIARNYTRYRWLIIYLLGASSSVHKTFNKCDKQLVKLDDSYYLKDGISFRHTKCGYRNNEDLFVSLDSLESYVNDLQKFVDLGMINDAREYYSPVRLKGKGKKNTLTSLLDKGIEYLEIRTIDLNPYSKVGIEVNDLYFLHAFLLFCLFKDESYTNGSFLGATEDKIATSNQDLVAERGLEDNLELTLPNGESITLQSWAIRILDEITELELFLGVKDTKYKEAIAFERKKVLDKSETYAWKQLEDVKKDSFIDFHINKAKEYLFFSQRDEFLLKGYEDLELSTQILLKSAITRGISFDFVDREENFVELVMADRRELVKQATKTSMDTYSSVLAMENKVVSKKIMDRYGISTPGGMTFQNIDEAIEAYSLFVGKKIVIKPKSENFGIGITIFKFPFVKAEYIKAVELAFQSKGSIIIEEFIAGNEYRFLVIDGAVAGILRRVPANVTGDGINTIVDLVKIKNRDPLRGKGYTRPLEKISLGITEDMFLKQTGRDFSDIPQKNEIVYLRENSNISTGGDSVDYTNDIPVAYKKIAVESAKAVDSKICGVDMIITDITKEAPEKNYSVIEVNFNPAIHIHCFPHKGENRKIADNILDALFRKNIGLKR
jgi:glutamate--cysteine ligase